MATVGVPAAACSEAATHGTEDALAGKDSKVRKGGASVVKGIVQGSQPQCLGGKTIDDVHGCMETVDPV